VGVLHLRPASWRHDVPDGPNFVPASIMPASRPVSPAARSTRWPRSQSTNVDRDDRAWWTTASSCTTTPVRSGNDCGSFVRAGGAHRAGARCTRRQRHIETQSPCPPGHHTGVRGVDRSWTDVLPLRRQRRAPQRVCSAAMLPRTCKPALRTSSPTTTAGRTRRRRCSV